MRRKLCWGRSACCIRMFEALFKETSVELDHESFHFKVSFGFADWSDFIFEFFFQVEIKLILESFVVPLHIFFLRFNSHCIFHYRAGLVETANLLYCSNLQVGIPINEGVGIGDSLE